MTMTEAGMEVFIKEEPGEEEEEEETDPGSFLAVYIREDEVKREPDPLQGDQSCKYLCYQCSYQGTCDEDIRNHIIGDHSNGVNLTDISDDNIQIGLKSWIPNEVDKTKKFRCPECTYSTDQKRYMKMHLESRHDRSIPQRSSSSKDPMQVFACPFCDFKARTMSTLCSHRKAKHEKVRYPCGECDYMASSKCHIDRHIKSIHEKVPHPCCQCTYVAFDSSNLKRHVRNYHEVLSCEHCDFCVVTKKSMREHVNDAHRDKLQRCPYCSYCGIPDMVRSHMYRSHKDKT